jgi:phosphoribosyl-ATP pyrophosphohydrolase
MSCYDHPALLFEDVQQMVFAEYVKNGYLLMWNLDEARQRITPNTELMQRLHGIADVAELGLINTEVSEAIEAVRHGESDHVAEELADIIIRVMNYASRHGIHLEDAILHKHLKNMQREKLHGKKV